MTWSYDDETKTLTISGSGAMDNYSWGNDAPWVTAYAKNITTVEVKSGVTTIGNYAFYQCTALESVTIPDTVTTIDKAAFCGCESLKNVAIPEGVTTIGSIAFKGCKALTSVKISDGVAEICDSAFESTGITEIKLPKSLRKLGAIVDEGKLGYVKNLKEVMPYVTELTAGFITKCYRWKICSLCKNCKRS